MTKSQQQETKQPKSGEKDNENATLKQKVKELQADKARLDTANANALKKLVTTILPHETRRLLQPPTTVGR